MTIIVFLLIAAGIIYFYLEDKKKNNKATEQPKPVEVIPIVIPFSLSGHYNLRVSPPDGNAWGDGTHPFDAKELEITPSHRGLGYRLGGDMQVKRTEGNLEVVTTLWGNRIPRSGSTSVQIQPPDGREVQFLIDGAWVYLMFHNDGSVLGRVWEPEGWVSGGYDRDNCWKYGNIFGRKE